MSSIEVFVTVGGITAIVWINWYFFMAQSKARSQVTQKKGKIKPSTRKTEAISPLIETNHH